MEIKIVKLSPEARIPYCAKIGDAACDLFSNEDYNLRPGERHLFKLGFAIKIPDGYYGKIEGRSGFALKDGCIPLGGVIDSGYVGEIGVILFNATPIDLYNTVFIKKGQKIAQIIFLKYNTAEFVEVESLEQTERGSNGFGSTN